MTVYAGEVVRVTNTSTFRDTTLVQADVDDVKITIWNRDGDEIVAETSMVWDTELEEWYYDWSSPTTAGRYRARVLVEGPADHLSWEYLNITLARDLAPT